MQNIAVNGYTRQQIIDVLHAKSYSRNILFKYDLLDQYDRKIKTLDTVESAEISCISNADIKRVAKLIIKDDPMINYANNRIQPYIIFKMPDGKYVEWSQGIYLLSSPVRYEYYGQVCRSIDAYDGNQILIDDKFEDRYTIASGTNYITAVKTILTSAGITKVNIAAISKNLPTDREWEPAISKLTAINSLLSEINYIPLYVDENGYFTSREYINPSLRAVEYTYQDDELSIISNGLIENVDLFNVPNKFVAYTSNPDSVSLRSVYTNENVLSPLSTVSRGRTITDVRLVTDIADQTTLDAYVARIAFEASQIYGYIDAETIIMPMHSINDLIQLNYSSLGISDKFTEVEWSMQLSAGSLMRHRLRRLISI